MSPLITAPVRKTLAACLVLALGTTAAHAQMRPPESGQLLQQVPPPQNSALSNDTGLDVERPAATPHADSAPFPVTRIEVTGATLLPTADLHALVASGEGTELTLGQLYALAERITRAYRGKGYPLAVAYVPAQKLSGGTVRIAVLEARYDRVILNNRSHTATRVLEATLAPLAKGEPVRQGPLDRSLLLLGDIPGVAVGSLLRPGSEPGTSDLYVNATDLPRYSGVVALDNFGNRYTGRVRAGGGLDVNSLLHQGDLLNISVLTSGSDLKYGRLDYKYLIGGQGAALGATVSSLNYKLGGDLRGLSAHGTAQIQGVYAAYPFIRSTHGNLYGRLSADRRRMSDDVDIIASRSHRHTFGWTATLAGDTRSDTGITNFSVAAAYGRLGFDNPLAEFVDAISTRTRGHYVKWTLSLARLQKLSADNAVYVGFRGQWANRNLDSVEQFYLGGADNVRGYDSGVVAGAQGQMLNVEFRHTLKLALPGTWVATAQADAGHVEVYKHRFADGANSARMMDVGLGLRWSGANQWAVNVDVARPVGARPELAGPTHAVRAWVQVRKGF